MPTPKLTPDAPATPAVPQLPPAVEALLDAWFSQFFQNQGPDLTPDLYNRCVQAKDDLKSRLADALTK